MSIVSSFKDLTGHRFGRLYVVERCENYVTPKGQQNAQWLCQCDCGSDLIKVTGSHLREGRTNSCGCLRKDSVSDAHKQYNKYDLNGDFGIGYTNKNEEFWFDLEDYNAIKDYCWYYNNHGYVEAMNKNRNRIFLHRLVMDVPEDMFVDHKCHPPVPEQQKDNRKSNLRIVSHCQNQMNESLAKNNTSGTTGVSYHTRDEKWAVQIRVNGKPMWLGAFTDIEDAIAARKSAELKYFGEYRYDANNKGV